MGNKLQHFSLIILFFCLGIIIPAVSIAADTGIPVVSSEELPSSSFLKKEKRSIANSVETSSLIMPSVGLRNAGDKWEDPFLPGDGESSDPNNVGSTGPIGDVSFPIIVSFLFLYLIYRGISASRRRNNHF